MYVIIPSWNGRHLLIDCLNSLGIQTDPEFSICVVDNGSSDGTVDWLRTEHPTVDVIVLSTNEGFSRAVNEGIRHVSDDVIVLLNNDTIVRQDWIEQCKKAVFEYPQYMIFSSKVLIQNSGGKLDTAGDGFTIAGFGYKRGWHEAAESYDRVEEVFSASGCAMIIRKRVFDTIGYFDEDFFAFGEDLDFCFRARLAGFRVGYYPWAVIEHRVRATAASRQTNFLYYRNLVWLIIKNLPASVLISCMPHILANNVLMFVRACLRGEMMVYVKGMGVAIQGFGRMWRKRREIQATRVIDPKEIMPLLEHDWIGVHRRLHRANRGS